MKKIFIILFSILLTISPINAQADSDTSGSSKVTYSTAPVVGPIYNIARDSKEYKEYKESKTEIGSSDSATETNENVNSGINKKNLFDRFVLSMKKGNIYKDYILPLLILLVVFLFILYKRGKKDEEEYNLAK